MLHSRQLDGLLRGHLPSAHDADPLPVAGGIQPFQTAILGRQIRDCTGAKNSDKHFFDIPGSCLRTFASTHHILFLFRIYPETYNYINELDFTRQQS